MTAVDSDSKLSSNTCLLALYAYGDSPQSQTFRVETEDLQDRWPQICHLGEDVHIVFKGGAGIGRIVRFTHLAWQLAQNGYASQLVGIVGSIESPEMLVPLRRSIFHYVQTVAFRGTDSPLRSLLKRLACYLPGSWTWKGPLVLVGSPVVEQLDRFVLLTADREIAFLFRRNEKSPWAVNKTGARDELTREYENHSRVCQVLGQHVPDLLGITHSGQKATITIEYIDERFLNNIVAATVFNKRQAFIQEAIAHLDFCYEVYRLLSGMDAVESSPVSKAEVGDLLQGIDQLLNQSESAEALCQAMFQTVGLSLPRLTQHCDFCVRNILIARAGRARVLIDWEDMQERCWPLVDFVLLRLSLKEVYADLFNISLVEFERLSVISQYLKKTWDLLAELLDMEQRQMHGAQLLSLACLCRQNLSKGRQATAEGLFRELIEHLSQHQATSDDKVLP